MDLYLLTSQEGALSLCKGAVDGCGVNVYELAHPDQIPLQSLDLESAVLITDSKCVEEHADSFGPLARASFLRRAVLCPDASAAHSALAILRDAWEAIVQPTPESLRCRLADWVELDFLNRKARLQTQQIRDVASVLETSSEDMTSLKQRITFLDRQREKLSSVLETMNMLSKLSQEINCLDLDEIITICVTKVPLLVNARYASLYLHNYERHTLELTRHNHGYRIDEVVPVNEQSKSAMCRALLERRILLIRDFDEYERLNELQVERPNAAKYASKSCIIAPMLAGDRVVAVLNLTDKRTGASFDQVNDLPPIEQLSVLVGAAIRNWQLFQELRLQAKTDAMTGFINHQTFFDELEKEVLRVRRYRSPLSMLMIDVDNFKLINDLYGHQLGDRVLTAVARIIRLNVRDTDIPARYGGDEFAVMLSQADLNRARLVAERIREMVEAETFTCDERELKLSLSIGAAEYRPGDSVAGFMNEADKALYEAKTQGRNRVEVIQST